MPDYLYAVGSALLWAISAPVINHGLALMPDSQRISWITLGLFMALLAGTAALSPSLVLIDQPIDINVYLILSGLCTFPLATIAYYMSGEAFEGRIEFASQFSKIKPLLSFVLALVILREAITSISLISITLIATGTLIFLIGAHQHAISARGVVLGLLAALFWALGELFMKMGLNLNHPIHANLVAICGGFAVSMVIAIPAIYNIRSYGSKMMTIWPFLLHGVISFALAYTLFFYSISKIGLVYTVLINAFWPILSILLSAVIRRMQGRMIAIPRPLIIGSLVLLSGSMVQVIALM